MMGIFRRPMEPEEALKKYKITIPEESKDMFRENPRSAVFKLWFEDKKIREGKYYSFAREISYGPTIPKMILDSCMEYACKPVVTRIQSAFL